MTRSFLLIAALALASAPASAQFLPPGAETWTLLTQDRVAQYVVELGTARAEGDTVVVLHGGFGAEHSYLIDPLLPLADRFHFVLYDQRGSLRSRVPVGADSLLIFDSFVSDLEALRVQLGLDRLTILAHSMGAAIAYGYLDRFPEHVRGLVLTVPAFPVWHEHLDRPPADPRLVPPSDTAAASARYRQFNEAAAERASAEITEEGFPDPNTLSVHETLNTPGVQKAAYGWYRIQTAAYNTCHAERWRQLRGFGRTFFNQRVADAVFAEAELPDLRATWDRFLPALEAFDGPVALVLGECDYLDPGAVIGQRLAARLPNAEVWTLPDAGHLFWIDAPEASASALTAALEHATGSAQ